MQDGKGYFQSLMFFHCKHSSDFFCFPRFGGYGYLPKRKSEKEKFKADGF